MSIIKEYSYLLYIKIRDRSCIDNSKQCINIIPSRVSSLDRVVSLRNLYRTHFIIYTDTFGAFAIPLGLHRSSSMPVHGISHNPPSTQADVFLTHLLWSTCIPGICRRIMLLKEVALRRGWEREEARRLVERDGWEEWRKMYKRADAGRFVSWNSAASRLFPPSLRNQAVHHVSPFFLPLLTVTSHTRGSHTGWFKTDRYRKGSHYLINLKTIEVFFVLKVLDRESRCWQ